jgi:choice-of-anchor B domain-containing protein
LITLALLFSLASTTDAFAQDLFGSAVAIAGTNVVVVKPGTSRGAAAVLIFARSADGSWQEVNRLEPIDPRPGEGFGASLAAATDVLLVASADPDVTWGAHVYRRVAGTWTPAGRIAWNPNASTSSLGSAPLDLAGLMRVAQPPARTVAIAPDGSIAAIAGTDRGTDEVRIVVPHAASNEWSESMRIQAPAASTRGRFGAALVLSPTHLVVGAPAANSRGMVYVYDRGAEGSWSDHVSIAPPAELPADAGFGAALAFDGDRVVVGAPGANLVLIYRLSENDAWTLEQTLRAPEGNISGFGSSLDINNNELLVGAPESDAIAGAVFRFQRAASTAQWLASGRMELASLDGPAALGVAVSLHPDIAVAGAAQARGGHGLAAVWVRGAAGSWSEPTMLEPGAPLEAVTGSEVRCADGEASRFACENVDLLAFLPISAIGGEPGERVSDLWGWTDPLTKREYALVARRGGIAIVDVSDASQPRYLGVLPGNPAGPRDVKVFKDHLFFVGDGAGDHGLLVFDLAQLRDVRETPVTFAPDARYQGMASAHNLVMDTETGTAIPVGSSGGGNTCGGGLHMVDVSDPLNPVFAGCYTDTEGLISPGRTHDAQCIVYRGPDVRYRERQVCFVANETALRIVDITDKASPAPIARATYPSRGYIHQGWLTDDQRYFFMNDEVDELVGLTDRTRTLIWDVADLEDPVLAGEYLGPDASTDHNLYIRGNRMYLANYQAGLRVVDISNPLKPVEIGFFDTTPWGGNPPGWVGGAWTAYPFLESGTVLVSSINEGLFLLRPRERPVS